MCVEALYRSVGYMVFLVKHKDKIVAILLQDIFSVVFHYSCHNNIIMLLWLTVYTCKQWKKLYYDPIGM